MSPHPAPPPDAPLHSWLAWQETLSVRAIELGLERVAVLAQRLRLLETPIPTLTVAGTNGKGSSAKLASEIYRAAGYRVGLYTSPHLLRYNERIELDGQPANDEMICAAFRAIETCREAVPLTYFEYGTLAALWLFREAGVQLRVLEVGLGGRLDAVNIVDADVALITSIGLDHTDWLGPDREAIGFEKAGILRPGRVAVCADPAPPTSIARHAHALPAPLQQIGRDFGYQAQTSGWAYWGSRPRASLPLPVTPGPQALQNAAGVLAAVDALGLSLPETAIAQALPRSRLPGRWQQIGTVWLDVAHNTEAAQALAERIAGLGQPVNLVLGMLADKPAQAFAATLAPWVAQTHLVDLPGPRGLSAAALAARIADVMPHPLLHTDLAAALHQARGPRPVVVTGSFLTVAAALECLHG